MTWCDSDKCFINEPVELAMKFSLCVLEDSVANFEKFR
jgi:hypothetical protein